MEHLRTANEGLICDFCNSAPVTRAYDASPIIFKPGPLIMHFLDTKWAACAACAVLIDENRWDSLTQRSVVLWYVNAQRNGMHVSRADLADITEQMLRLHQLFREARKRTA
jgi:hypothetical protein